MFDDMRKKDFVDRVRYQRELDVLYMNVPKASCTTIKRVLFCAAGGGVYKNPLQFDKSVQGSFLAYNERKVLCDNFPPSFLFTFVRNPYSRIFSAFFDKIYGGRSS